MNLAKAPRSLRFEAAVNSVGQTVENNSGKKVSAVAGLIAGGGAAARTRDPLAMTAGATAGAIVGGIAGSFVRRELARFVARRDPWSGLWQMTSVPMPQPIQLSFVQAQ